ncbi:hypothetical protein BDV39DRAFT_211142 [Aspergillus sergii]|uniref:Uncharacterized protein n=1 Tax=Aspergillus sergii TaxID=1034303 RepID=A0A5N6WJH7_9EURO|nr:hypothetical protein BDV39DRAFT_211142 [Aspergillus sergii]
MAKQRFRGLWPRREEISLAPKQVRVLKLQSPLESVSPDLGWVGLGRSHDSAQGTVGGPPRIHCSEPLAGQSSGIEPLRLNDYLCQSSTGVHRVNLASSRYVLHETALFMSQSERVSMPSAASWSQRMGLLAPSPAGESLERNGVHKDLPRSLNPQNFLS